MYMQTVDVSSARAEEADEARWDGLHQRAPPGGGRVHDAFLRKTSPCSSFYHISQQRGCVRVWHHHQLACGAGPAVACWGRVGQRGGLACASTAGGRSWAAGRALAASGPTCHPITTLL